MLSADIRAAHEKMVTVVTYAGLPIAVGRLQVVEAGSSLSVELSFKTEVVRCTLVLLPDEVAALLKTEQAEVYRHVLPEGDKLWRAVLPDEPVSKEAPPREEEPAIVETYPLPPASRLGATLPDQPSKQARPPTTSKPAPPLPGSKPMPAQKLPPIEAIKVEKVKPLPGSNK